MDGYKQFGNEKKRGEITEKRLVLDRLEHNIRKSEDDWEDMGEDCSSYENQNTVGSNLKIEEPLVIEIKEEVRFKKEPDIIYIDSSSDDEMVLHEYQDEEELYKPEKYVCQICQEFFFTKPMLKRHEELHNKGIIYLAGQSVVPVSWIGRQTTKKKKPTPDNSPIRKKVKKPNAILEQQKKQSFTIEEDRRSSQNRNHNRKATDDIREPSWACQFEEQLQDDSSRSSSSLNSPCKLTSNTIESPGLAENQMSIPREIGPHLEYYDGDKRLPIIMRECKGVKTREAINFIINEDNLDKDNISTIVPTIIKENVSFLVDTKRIGSWKNLLSDDMGTWKTTCAANRFYKWDEKGDLITTPSKQPECFMVYRHQYVNLSSPDLHRIIVRAGTSPEKMMKTVFVQYYFEEEEHAVLVQPHGNRKQDNKPYKRTQETIKNTIRELNINKRPKDVFHTILERTGGIENLTSGSQKPRDMQQVYNLKRKESNDEILETIDLRATEEIKFIRHIEMVPEFSVFLATDNQLHEIEKYCTNNANFSILGVDTTFNIGNFYVTLTTYRNLMLEHKTKKHEPVMIGPVLIHQQRTHDSFYMLPSFMIRTKPTLNKILVYGTDGELNLKTSFSSCLPFAHHLLCDIHMKDNIISKLTSLNLKGAVRQLYMDEIFGKQMQEIFFFFNWFGGDLLMK